MIIQLSTHCAEEDGNRVFCVLTSGARIPGFSPHFGLEIFCAICITGRYDVNTVDHSLKNYQ